MILTGRDLRWYIETGKLGIHPITGDQFQQNGVDFILAEVDSENRGAYNFRLGTTAERLTMPDDLMAFVELRSTWARRGFLIPPTIVDAGFDGQITLEIVSLAGEPFPVGQRFAHLIFARLSGPAEPYRGKYQGQVGITEAK